jgi:hypothetical protein
MDILRDECHGFAARFQRARDRDIHHPGRRSQSLARPGLPCNAPSVQNADCQASDIEGRTKAKSAKLELRYRSEYEFTPNGLRPGLFVSFEAN